jgi:hypothetical protein
VKLLVRLDLVAGFFVVRPPTRFLLALVRHLDPPSKDVPAFADDTY